MRYEKFALFDRNRHLGNGTMGQLLLLGLLCIQVIGSRSIRVGFDDLM